MSCLVHPHRTGGNVKTIGLFPRDGETTEQAYSRWAIGRGEACTCEKPKPLFVAVERETGSFVLEVDGRDVFTGLWFSYDQARQMTEHMNAAADRREAKLRGTLMQVGAAIRSVIPNPELAASWERLKQLIDDTLLGGGVDYVPAEQLRAAEAKVKGTWGALADLVQEGGLADERAAVLMEALGLEVPTPERPLIPLGHKFTREEWHRITRDPAVRAALDYSAATGASAAAIAGRLGQPFGGGEIEDEVPAILDNSYVVPRRQLESMRGNAPSPGSTIPPRPPSATQRLATDIQRQHLAAVDEVVRRLARNDMADGIERRVETTLPAGVLARETVRAGNLEVIVTTRLENGVARTTAEQRDRRDYERAPLPEPTSGVSRPR